MRDQSKLYEAPNPLDSKVKSIGFQNQTHWVSKPNPLGFKTKPIGFQSETHWILRAIERVLGVKASRLVSAFRLQWSTISLYPRARRAAGGGEAVGVRREAAGRCGGCGVWRCRWQGVESIKRRGGVPVPLGRGRWRGRGVRREVAGRCGGCGASRMCGGRRGTGRHPRRLMVLVACVHDLCDALIHEEAAGTCYLKGGISGTIKGA